MPDEQLIDYNRRLADLGIRLTPRRQKVLEVLVGHPGHITADEVLAQVQKSYPLANKTTVYRTLDILTTAGLVATSHTAGHQAIYQIAAEPHHHLICKECGAETELADGSLDPLRERIATEYGFEPCFKHFVLFGVCPDCRRTSPAK
ncbi:MAG: transcriptional repressor [Chloroflexota bacterium]|nr:transcriptional repressor [Chloroflexota bacterium]